ncbi:MAG: hypothetical protein ACU837_06410 [Gammaproteobacteria bacterium]
MKTYAGPLLALLLHAGSAGAHSLQYIYIEANEGGSSGGHVALQFGAEVFHYQFSGGLIRLFKQDAADFRFDYRFLQNRTLHVADIAVSKQTYHRLHRYFKLRYFEQEQQIKRLRDVQQDRLLSTWLLRRSSAENSVTAGFPEADLRLRGAGLFFNDSDFTMLEKPQGECVSSAAAKTILLPLRQSLERQYGADVLMRLEKHATDAIRRLSPTPPPSGASAYAFYERYSDLLNELLALRVLREARPLTVDACFALHAPEWRLDNREIRALHALQERLSATARALTVSKRPDRGYALLVTTARLVAIEQSLQSGYWVLADDFKPDSSIVPPSDLRHYAEELRAQRGDALADLRAARTGNTYDEHGYSSIEMAANRYHEWLQAGQRQSVRYRGEQPLPTKSIRIPNLAFPDLSVQQLRAAIQQQEKTAQQLIRGLEKHYAYHLLTRNCATEIFRDVDVALSPETAQRLGGKIDSPFRMIPFAAFAEVQQTYRVIKTSALPAYRQLQLARQYAQETDVLVYAREANVLSATLYSRNPDDAWFVFFTDDALLLRPLFGAFNTLAGIGQSMYGMLRLPFDGGSELTSGARGILMSLPELAFINMRKGSYRYLSQRRLMTSLTTGR